MGRPSKRIPGPPYHFIDAVSLREEDDNAVKRMEVHGDGERGIQVRSANREDGLRIGEKQSERSALK